jgi:thioredoxin-like negative regulator of GroEL
MYPVMEKLSKGGLDIEFIDSDKQENLVKTYKIKLLPTIIILKGNKILKTYTGVISEQTIYDFLKSVDDYKIF